MSLNSFEATEGRRNHGPGPRGPNNNNNNDNNNNNNNNINNNNNYYYCYYSKFCNVPKLESFGTFSMFIYSLILND